MRKTPDPIREVLRDSTPDAVETERAWRALQARQAPAQGRARWAWAAVPALASMAVAVWLTAGRSPSVPRAGLHLADGRPIGPVNATQATTLGFDDGTQIELEAGTRLEPVLNDAEEVRFALALGRVRVARRASTRPAWSVDAGPVELRFRTATFAAWRSDDALEVVVYSGEVRLRIESTTGQVRTLGAGETVRVALGTPAGSAHVPERADAPVAAAPPEAAQPDPRAPARAKHAQLVEREPPAAQAPADPAPAPARAWQALAKQGEYADAYAALGRDQIDTVANTSRSIDELLALADVLRQTGHAIEAVAPLERASQALADDRRAGLAAYTLGRVLTDDLHQPARGAEAFARAIRLGLPAALGEAAYLRLVESRLAGGDRPGAEEAYQGYRAAFGEGRMAEQLRGLLGR